MSVLHISPDSDVLVHAAAAAVLYLRIGAGTVGLLAGAAALVLRKGSRLHRQAGNVFVVAMLVISAIGATLAPFLPTLHSQRHGHRQDHRQDVAQRMELRSP